MDEGAEVDDVIRKMDYDFTSTSVGADVYETEILDWIMK
jgi:hypothetical protein